MDQIAEDGFSRVPAGIRWLNSITEAANLCAELGDAERATELIAILEPVRDLHGVFCIPVNYGGPVTAALSGLEDLCGRPDKALEYARRAAESATALGAKPMEMRTRRDLARLLKREGETANAAEELHLAERIASEFELVDAFRPKPNA